MHGSLPYYISPRMLLSVYAIVPVLLCLVVVDIFFFGAVLKKTFTIDTTTAALYVLFLEVPHIIGSFIGYAERAYLVHYKRKLFVHIPILCLLVTLLAEVHFPLVFVTYLVYTMYHALKQQTGIAKLLLGNTGLTTLHTVWSVLGISAGAVGSLLVYKPYIMDVVAEMVTIELLTGISILFVFVSVCYAVLTRNRGMGWVYLLATIFMMVGMYSLLLLGYVFFAIFIIRFVHDVTAFIFYAVHDANRNAHTVQNTIYKIACQCNVPLIIITPLLALLIAFGVRSYASVFSSGAYLVMLIGFVHYYIEGFMWKRGSLHRAQLRFIP